MVPYGDHDTDGVKVPNCFSIFEYICGNVADNGHSTSFRFHCNNSFLDLSFVSIEIFIVVIWHMFITFNALISVKV